jgi:F-type H+-transporting ATPase subunit delta
MASGSKQTHQLAHQLFKLSLENGAVSDARVAGVLEYVEKHRPAHAMAVLKAYHRLVAAEVARSRAVIEHAGSLQPEALTQIASAMSRKYGRAITPVAQRNDSLLAGVRVRVGDDTYESSIAGQLAALASAL